MENVMDVRDKTDFKLKKNEGVLLETPSGLAFSKRRIYKNPSFGKGARGRVF